MYVSGMSKCQVSRSRNRIHTIKFQLYTMIQYSINSFKCGWKEKNHKTKKNSNLFIITSMRPCDTSWYKLSMVQARLDTCSAPSHYQNNADELSTGFQWNLNQNTHLLNKILLKILPVKCWIFFYTQWINSLVPERCGSNFKSVISEHTLWVKFMGISCEIVLRWIPQHTCDDKRTLVQVMVWHHQAESRYILNQCWLHILSRVCLRCSQFSWLSSLQHMGLNVFNWPIQV